MPQDYQDQFKEWRFQHLFSIVMTKVKVDENSETIVQIKHPRTK